jgi:hypothetical protein
MFPQDPITAVTHPDPYAYYADLVAHRPLYYDDKLRLWVASSASAVATVLTHHLCRVRPADEPVPKSLLGSPAAEIFRRLIRMNDGERHCPFKQAVSAFRPLNRAISGRDFFWMRGNRSVCRASPITCRSMSLAVFSAFPRTCSIRPLCG